jgi:hypothetical protein
LTQNYALLLIAQQEYISAMRSMNQRVDWNTILDGAIGRPHCEFLMIEKFRTVLMV